jgi:hypothetical protein
VYISFVGTLHYKEAIHKLLKSVEFVGDRVSCIVLRGHWSNTIVLNVHALSEEKTDDTKDSFYEEEEQVFGYLPKYHLKILVGDFNAVSEREHILKPTIWNESLHYDSSDNGVRIVYFARSKHLFVKSTMFLH